MATGSVNRLAMHRKEYFDHVALNWDCEVTGERLECLNNIIKELRIKSGDYVLDIGSGTGILLPFLIPAVGGKGKVIVLDFSQEMVKQAKAKDFSAVVDYVRADVTAIPLSDSRIDLAICNSVFPHFGNKAKALEEMARVIRHDGRLVICHTVSRETINRLHQSIGGIVANDFLPDESELREMAEQAGLKITRYEDRPKRYLVIAGRMAPDPG
jgi:ubiquinone/menaquinone biosynthesis C-methylase UbiE